MRLIVVRGEGEARNDLAQQLSHELAVPQRHPREVYKLGSFAVLEDWITTSDGVAFDRRLRHRLATVADQIVDLQETPTGWYGRRESNQIMTFIEQAVGIEAQYIPLGTVAPEARLSQVMAALNEVQFRPVSPV